MPYLIVFLPLIGALLGYSLKSLGDRYSEVITTAFLFLSAILSIIIFYNGIVYGEYSNYKIIEWISSGSLKVDWSINIDPLSLDNVSCCNLSLIFSTLVFNRVYESRSKQTKVYVLPIIVYFCYVDVGSF